MLGGSIHVYTLGTPYLSDLPLMLLRATLLRLYSMCSRAIFMALRCLARPHGIRAPLLLLRPRLSAGLQRRPQSSLQTRSNGPVPAELHKPPGPGRSQYEYPHLTFQAEPSLYEPFCKQSLAVTIMPFLAATVSIMVLPTGVCASVHVRLPMHSESIDPTTRLRGK